MAHPDLDQLLDTLFGFANEMLAKAGEFYPFGAYINKEGQLAHLGGYTGDEHPPPSEVIELLVGGLKGMAREGNLRAGGICLDVRVVPPGQSDKCDAICARLEHENGESVDAFLPYVIRGGAIEHGQIFASAGGKEYFA